MMMLGMMMIGEWVSMVAQGRIYHKNNSLPTLGMPLEHRVRRGMANHMGQINATEISLTANSKTFIVMTLELPQLALDDLHLRLPL